MNERYTFIETSSSINSIGKEQQFLQVFLAGQHPWHSSLMASVWMKRTQWARRRFPER
jgi:hypothetical protein